MANLMLVLRSGNGSNQMHCYSSRRNERNPIIIWYLCGVIMDAGAPIEYIDRLFRYSNAHYNDTTVMEPSFLYYKMSSLYWDNPPIVTSFTKEVNQRLAKRQLKTNGRLANLVLTSSAKEATGVSQIAKFMGPTWGPPGFCRPLMGPMLAPCTLLSG